MHAGNQGAATLSLLPQYNDVLQEINLSHCGLGDSGGMALAQALAKNHTMHTVAMDGMYNAQPVLLQYSAVNDKRCTPPRDRESPR